MEFKKQVRAILEKLPAQTRDDLIAVVLIDQAARDASLTLPPQLVAVVERFIRRAGIPASATPDRIWAAIDTYVASAPLVAAAVEELKAALAED